jgi:hypothetical protein
MDEVKTNEVVKPRKRKAAARWAMFEQVTNDPANDNTDDVLYRIVVDGCKSEKAVKAEAELTKIDGAVLLVCIHEAGEAKPETKTLFNWKK